MAAAPDAETKFEEKKPDAPRRPRRDFGLSPSELDDLCLFFDGAEGIFGVRSSQGALEDELARRCPSDGFREDVAKENRAKAVRRRRPKRTSLSDGFSKLRAAFGLPPTQFREDDDDLPLWAIEALGGSDDHAYAASGGNFDEDAAGRMSHVRRRLVLVGDDWTGVLFAAHGPRAAQWAKDGRGNPTHPATFFGSHLVEIVVAILRFENFSAGEKLDARAQIWSFASGEGRAVDLRNDARGFFENASTAYQKTRCSRPCRRCWPA